jgi:ACS family D-galactonate transporter-like MFS transporter
MMNALEEKMITPIKPESGKRWFAVFMVSLAITINYLDRVNFSVATPTMMEYFGLTAGQMGVLMSAFFWSYTITMIPAGALLNRFGPKQILGFSAAGWGLVTMLTGACQNFAMFLGIRIALGSVRQNAANTGASAN